MSRHHSHPETNFDVDFVISYRYLGTGIFGLPSDLPYCLSSQYSSTDKSEALNEFQKLIQSLAQVGLQTEVRNGENHTILIFVKAANDEALGTAVYRSRYVGRRLRKSSH